MHLYEMLPPPSPRQRGRFIPSLRAEGEASSVIIVDCFSRYCSLAMTAQRRSVKNYEEQCDEYDITKIVRAERRHNFRTAFFWFVFCRTKNERSRNKEIPACAGMTAIKNGRIENSPIFLIIRNQPHQFIQIRR